MTPHGRILVPSDFMSKYSSTLAGLCTSSDINHVSTLDNFCVPENPVRVSEYHSPLKLVSTAGLMLDRVANAAFLGRNYFGFTSLGTCGSTKIITSDGLLLHPAGRCKLILDAWNLRHRELNGTFSDEANWFKFSLDDYKRLTAPEFSLKDPLFGRSLQPAEILASPFWNTLARSSKHVSQELRFKGDLLKCYIAHTLFAEEAAGRHENFQRDFFSINPFHSYNSEAWGDLQNYATLWPITLDFEGDGSGVRINAIRAIENGSFAFAPEDSLHAQRHASPLILELIARK